MINRLTTLLTLLALLSGCVTETIRTTNIPVVSTYAEELAEEEVLDIAVVPFDLGFLDSELKEGVYPEIRRAESAFMARELVSVLDNQGVWGASRVVPSKDHISDVLITGSIEKSHGEALTLAIKVVDAQGRTWLNRPYNENVSRYAYDPAQRLRGDPFSALYVEIVNDVIAFFKTLTREQRLSIRNVSKLKFAQSFAPEAYEGYLQSNESKITTAVRLAAHEDPMMARIGAIQRRTNVFIDTLQGHYENFSSAMDNPYYEWRRLTYKENVALQSLSSQQEELTRGGIVLLAGLAAATSDNRNVRTAGAVGMAAGGVLVKRGLEARTEASIHKLALEELGQSLEAEITPQVIELEDRTIQLSGTIEDQYGQWREILSDIYAAEIAELPTDISQPSQ